MATIKVGDRDLVFLVKADERSAGGVVFSPNLLVMVGDQQLELVQRVKLEAAVEDSFPKVSIDLISSEAEGGIRRAQDPRQQVPRPVEASATVYLHSRAWAR